MKIALVTDAWAPQVNGVVRTLTETVARLRAAGHDVEIVSPDQYRSIPCPGYGEIRLAITPHGSVARRLKRFAPDAIHIATEGPLGYSARRYCRRHDLPFSTAYHTQFPVYVARRTGLPAAMFWPYIRRFHSHSDAVLVATAGIRAQLSDNGVENLRHWGRGVDLAHFHPAAPPPEIFATLPRPIQLYVGRVAVEKNIGAFLDSGHRGSKVVVGDGPARDALQVRYPDALFLGSKSGEELAGCYAGADVFVFPSRTDTFGLVIIEALACGTPVAAYPVQGPVDILSPESGAMHDDLGQAIAGALKCDPADCIRHARTFSWDASTAQFLDALVPIAVPVQRAAA